MDEIEYREKIKKLEAEMNFLKGLNKAIDIARGSSDIKDFVMKVKAYVEAGME